MEKTKDTDFIVTSEQIGEMMTRVAPSLGRLMLTIPEEEQAVALMALSAWGVFHIGALFGEDAARQFSMSMAQQAGEINNIVEQSIALQEEEEEEEGPKRYDA